MKKIFFQKFKVMLLISSILLLSACQYAGDSTDDGNVISTSTLIETPSGNTLTKGANDQNLADFLDRSDSLETPQREYGSPEVVNINIGKFLAHISYPTGGLGQLDKACKDWAEATLATFQKESEKGDGELSISYNSYIVNNNYVVVEFKGNYQNQHYAHPEAIMATFNADINTGDLLSLNDILSEEGIEKLTELVIQSAGIATENIDDDLLNKWQIKEEGIEVFLPQSKYLPSSEGDKVVLVNYQDLKKSVVQSNENEKEDASNAEQTTTATIDSPPVKYIALTFDDGPGNDTARLLDILKENGVKATFFLLGSQIDSHPEVVKRMVAEGHEIGDHSWSHKSFVTLNNQQLTQEIMQTKAKIFEVAGVDTFAVRPPYGAFNNRVRDVAAGLGVYFVNWNIDPVDWKTRNMQSTYDEIINTAADGNIVLCHDIHSSTVDAMALVIPKLLSENYQFITATEMIKLDRGEVQPGMVYYSRYK